LETTAAHALVERDRDARRGRVPVAVDVHVRLLLREPQPLAHALDDAEVGLMRDEQVDLVIPHQANLRIIEGVRERLGLAEEKAYVNIDRYGNTSSASIPIALDECVRSGRLK